MKLSGWNIGKSNPKIKSEPIESSTLTEAQAILNARDRVAQINEKKSPDNFDRAFGAIVALSHVSKEWAADFAGKLMPPAVVLGDFLANDHPWPVRLWVPFTVESSPESTMRFGYVTRDGIRRQPIAVASGADLCVTPEDLVYADALWALGQVMLNSDPEKVGEPILVVPELDLDEMLIKQALQRHYLPTVTTHQA